jgi:hypothetical protein
LFGRLHECATVPTCCHARLLAAARNNAAEMHQGHLGLHSRSGLRKRNLLQDRNFDRPAITPEEPSQSRDHTERNYSASRNSDIPELASRSFVPSCAVYAIVGADQLLMGMIFFSGAYQTKSLNNLPTVDHEIGPVLTLVEAARLIGSYSSLQSAFGQLLFE